MYVTNVTVLRGDRGVTEVTPYDILEAVHRVHGQACVNSVYSAARNTYFFKIHNQQILVGWTMVKYK